MNDSNEEDRDSSLVEPTMMREKGTLVFGALAGIAVAYVCSWNFRLARQPNDGHLFIGLLVAGAIAGAFASLFVREQRANKVITFNGWCLILMAIALCVALLPDVG